MWIAPLILLSAHLVAANAVAHDAPVFDVNRSIQCQGLLWQARGAGHSNPSLSRAATAEAVGAFRDFSTYFLQTQEHVNTAHYDAVSSLRGEPSTETLLPNIAGRIEGIESFYAAPLEEGRIIFGNTYSGAENIELFANELQLHLNEVSSRGFTGSVRRTREGEAIGSTLMSMVSTFGLGMAAGAHFGMENDSIRLVGLTIAGLGMVVAGMSYLNAEIDFLEIAKHFRNVQDSSLTKFIELTEANAREAKLGERQWLYHSFNGELPAMAINAVVLGGEVAREYFKLKSLEKHIEYFSLLGPVAKHLRRLKMGSSQRSVFNRDTQLHRVFWDAVLYRDEEGTPHLVTMLRTAKQLPEDRGGPRRHERVGAAESSSATALVPEAP